MTYRIDTTAMEGTLSDIEEPIRLHKVDETKWESYWDKLVNKYHYLGYVWQFGGRIKYLITTGDRIIGAIGFCSAVYRLALVTDISDGMRPRGYHFCPT